MTIEVGGSAGGSISQFPQLPLPLSDEGFLSSQGNFIPHKGTLINQVLMPINFVTSLNGNYQGYLSGTQVWGVSPTTLNGSCDGFLGAGSATIYDSVNDRLYVFGVDQGTSPATIYTAYITLETGAVTNVGSVQLGTNPASYTVYGDCAVHRAAIDSGDFTLYFQDRTVVINESTGAEVSNVANTNTSENSTNSIKVGSYVTLDGTLILNSILQSANYAEMYLSKAGNTAFVPVPVRSLIGTQAAADVFMFAWGDVIKVMSNSTNTGQTMLRTLPRTETDAWLQLVAQYGGLA